jgi:hypothetical protein
MAKKSKTKAASRKALPTAAQRSEPAVNIPADLRRFLKAGKQLKYAAEKCECEQVTLLPLDQLRVQEFPIVTSELQNIYGDPHNLEGYYLVPGINLIASSDNYDPEGILIWLTEESLFGSWDCDHCTIDVFVDSAAMLSNPRSAGIGWSKIAANPLYYLNAAWGYPDALRAKKLIPWPKYAWKKGRP